MARADVFVFYDDVQFDKNGWRNRNRIRTQGEAGWSWLTVPVRLPRSFARLLDVEIDVRAPWARKHRRTLESAYASAPFREQLTRFEAVLKNPSTKLVDVAIASTLAIAEALEVRPKILRSSELGVEGTRNERLLAVCRAVGATEYYSGKAAEEYLDVALFERAGIRVTFQDFAHPIYEQCYRPFVSHLSAIDALLCAGPERTRAMLESRILA
jgi:hypothetical protein